MMYGIQCKKKFFSTWPLELKNGLDGLATVEIIDFANMVFYDKYRIFSPSKEYSIEINTAIINEDYEIHVYVVSEGGYLLLCGQFSEDRTELDIIMPNWKRINKKIFHEMYVRTTSILEKMKID